MKKNVVVIVSDQHQAKAMGCSGHRIVKTPNIDALAECGVQFNRAYCASPLCAPSRAAYITSSLPHRNSAMYHIHKIEGEATASGFHRFPGIKEEFTSMGDYFKSHDYATAAIGKVHVHGETREYDLGFETRMLRFYTYNFEDYEEAVSEGDSALGKRKRLQYTSRGEEGFPYDYSWTGQYNNLDDRCPAVIETMTESCLEEGDMFDVLTTEASLKYIEQNKEKPFLLHVGLEKPHPPWTEVQRFMDLYSAEDIEDDALPLAWDEENRSFLMDWLQGTPTKEKVKIAQASYYANITSLDEKVGKIIQKLKDENLFHNTIVVYTSDHGEMCYDHAQIEKHCMYESSVRVPLILSGPSLPQNKKIHRPVSLIDLLPTLGELCELEPAESFEGESVVPYLQDEKGLDEKWIYCEFTQVGYSSHPQGSGRRVPMRMVRNADYKYIYTHNLPDQLYEVDSEEIYSKDNLAATHRGVVQSMKAMALAGWHSDGMLKKHSEELDIEDLLGDNHLKFILSNQEGRSKVLLVPVSEPVKTWDPFLEKLVSQKIRKIKIFVGAENHFHKAQQLRTVEICNEDKIEILLSPNPSESYAWLVAESEDSTLSASKEIKL